WWVWKDRSGQYGNPPLPAMSGGAATDGSMQFGPVPCDQPRPVVLPLALSQPPEYQDQLTPASLMRSPMFMAVVLSSMGGSLVPNALVGWYEGCMVLTA